LPLFFAPDSKINPSVNWNHVVIPEAFIKFGSTQKINNVLGKIRII